MRKSGMAKTATKAAAKTEAKPAPSTPAKSPAKAAAPAPPPAAKPILRTTGLSPKQQKLQALLAKTAHATSGAKPLPGASAQAFKAKTNFAGKKTSFQRKAV
jgi:hypothetical protein